MVLDHFRRDPFVGMLLFFCQQTGEFAFYTGNYPVYRMLMKVISVYPELDIIEVSYKGNSLSL